MDGLRGLTLGAAWLALAVVGWYVLVPLAVGSLATGLVMALGTSWGLLRHYWVVFSLVLTTLAAGILAGHMPTVSAFAAEAAGGQPSRAGLAGELLHAGGGLVVLLAVAGLNVSKPKGLTPLGRRQDRPAGSEG